MEVKKGFFFSLDVAFAIALAIILSVGILFNLTRNQDITSENLYLSKLANDILITLSKNKTLETLDNTTITNSLKNILPQNLGATLNITTFECANPGSNGCNEFREKGNCCLITLPVGGTEQNAIIARTSFVNFSSERINLYALASLKVWSL